jgi:hypothetical protein
MGPILTIPCQHGIPHLSLNRAGTPPTFEYVGAIRDEKIDQSKVRLADVDGDGRADVGNSRENAFRNPN